MIEVYIIFKSNLRRKTILAVSDRRPECLCPFGRIELDVRKLSDRKIERCEFTPVGHTHR